MAGWGTSSWGLSTWGFGGVGPLTITSVFVTSERSFVVELSRPPRAVSTIGPGDALNPTTWAVTRLDTDASFLVLAVRPYSGSQQFELFLLDKLANALITHRVQSDTLVDSNGSLIALPNYYDFLGCEAVTIAPADRTMVDLANPQTGRDSIEGALSVGSDGDYENETGLALYKKLIIRRLVTMPGDFFHYDPTYGLGVRLKEPYVINDLAKLKAEAERQLLREPEFSAVTCPITLNADGVMTITARVRIRRTNELFAIPIQVPTSIVAL